MRIRLVAIVGAGLLAAPVANAQTFCVYSPPGCVGVAQPTVAAAMIAGTLTPERDLVRIGPGDHLEPGWIGNGQQIDIVGSGATQTIIRPETNAVIFQVPTGGTLSDVGFVGADGAGGTLISASGSITRIRVTSAPTFNGTAVGLSGDGSISDSTIVVPTDGGTSGISVQAGLVTKRISDVDIQAGVGISAQSPTVVQRVRVTAGHFGITSRSGVQVDNALIRMLNVGTFLDSAGLVAESDGGIGFPAEIIGSHITVIGSGRAGEAGAAAHGFATGLSATVVLRDSIVRGTPISVTRDAVIGSTAGIIATHSAFDPATALATGLGVGSLDIFSPTNTSADPLFVNAAAGDYRLSATSPVRDVGSPDPLGATESPTDVDGNARILDAAGVCGSSGRRDMGAFEFVPAVRAAGTVAPAEVAVGVSVTFTFSGCDPGTSQAPVVEWTFDDGATATGSQVTHAFVSPGVHQATVTVRRAAGGSTASATVNLVVKDITAPRMTITTSAVRLTRTGIARIGLRCPAAEISGPCRGTLTLKSAAKVPVRVGGRTVQRVITVGTVAFVVPAGSLRTVPVRVSATGRALIAARGSLSVRASAAARDSVGNRRTVSRLTTLRRALVR